MAWQIPQSQTIAGIVADLGTTDDVFVASDVTIASTAGWVTIDGNGSGHEALIYGTVASTGSNTITLGDNPTLDSSETVTIKSGGQVFNFGLGGTAIQCVATDSHIVNEGLIAAPDGRGITLIGISATTTSTINNSGTIDVGGIAISVGSGGTNEAIAIQNSGLISGGEAAYFAFAIAKEQITNTGRIVGDISLGGGNDVYSGAKGRLNGDVFGGDGNDVITGGVDNDTLNGDADNDTLTGGLGRDSLTGGTGRDFFDFNSIKESVKGANRDVILDFNRTVDDRVDLATIDAKTGVGGNQAFKFIGTAAFHDVKGELRCKNGIVQGDVNGDGVADFEIKVNLATMVAGDFFL